MKGALYVYFKVNVSTNQFCKNQYSSSVQMPLPLFRVPTVVASYRGTMLSKIKIVASLGQQHKVTESTGQKWDVNQVQATLSQTCYLKVHYLDTRLPETNFRKSLILCRQKHCTGGSFQEGLNLNPFCLFPLL